MGTAPVDVHGKRGIFGGFPFWFINDWHVFYPF
jgi:hypothetical protein